MRIQNYLICCCLLVLGAGAIQSQTQYTGPDNGDWFTAGNWNNGLPAAGNDALIGGGITVVVGSPLTVNFSITAFGNISVSAAITVQPGGSIANSGTLSIASSGSLTNNGTVQNFGTMTFAGTAGFTNGVAANFTNGGSFTLQTTLLNQGAIVNNGTIDATNGTLQSGGTFDNNQTLTTKSLTINTGSNFTNNFGATLNITGATGILLVNGGFTNNGTVNASGSMTVNGSFANNVFLNILAGSVLTINASGQLTNSGTLDNLGFVQNYGTLTNGQTFINRGETNNFGTFNNNNLIDNKTGATFFNLTAGTLGMGFGSKILNGGTFTNQNVINSFGTIENNGTFNNSGTLHNFGGSMLSNNSVFTNNNILSTNDVVNNDGTFTNNGTINVNGGSVWSNNAIFSNATGATVNVVQDFNNKTTGVLTNNGTFRNQVRTSNAGSFTNNAFLYNPGDFTNAAGATLTNKEFFLLEAGNLLNAGSFVNQKRTLVDECSSIRNTGSINNTGGNLELRGILFQKGTLSGAAVNNQGGYIHTAATSAAPSVCKNGTFGANIDGDIKVYAGSLVAFENFDSCANIIYLANGIDKPVFHCADIGTVQNLNLVVRTRLGDSLTCVAQVTPVDLLEPQFNNCPKDQVIFTPNSTAVATWTAPTATDNCTTTSLTTTHTPGSSFPVGITGVTYTAKDAYNNQNQCQFRIDVRQTAPGSNCTGDNTGPTFTGCPSNINIQRLAPLTVATWTPPTPNDNCKPINLTSTHVPGQGFPVGTTTVTYTARDGNNNSSTCTFTVTVTAIDPCLNDTQKPAISGCPANSWLPVNTEISGAVAFWNAPNVSDNCGVTSFTASQTPGAVFPVGTTTVTYTATDAASNSATCSFLVTVGNDPCPGDVTAPSISGCPVNINLLTSGANATATWTAPTANDPCAPVTVNNNFAPGSSFPLGVTQVTYQFSDRKGNSNTCNFTVTVQNSCSVDNVPPTITGCPANITVAATGTGGATATWTPPTATDNCGLTSFTSSFLPGANFPVGTTTVVYTAIDAKGNSSNCSFNVTVVNVPGCTTNAAPINNTTNVNPASVTLSWVSSANATSYNVLLGTTNPPTTTVASNVTGTSTTVTNLLAGSVYYWYVVPKNTAGSAIGCASSVTSFTTSGNTSGSDCNVTLGSIIREIWHTNTWNLNSIDGFGAPNATAVLTQFALTATENGNNYMDRVRGFLVPSATGNYTFNVTGDDYTELFLSTNANPANKQKIAWHNGFTGQTEYTKFSTQTSAVINLQAGQTYYIELRHLEGSGQDHFRVSWKTPSSNTWTIVPGARLAPFSDIVSPKAICKNITLQLPAAGQSVQISGQQVDNGSTAGCGATITSYNVSPTSFSQPGTFTATLTVTNSFGLSSTCTATVTVLAPPCTINNVVCESRVNDGNWATLEGCAVTVCAGDKLILSVNPNGLTSYQWAGPNGFSATGNSGGDALISNNITAAQAGAYLVTLTNASGCTATKSIQVTVKTCSNCPGNLLVNEGFENGTAGWTWMQNAGTTASSPYAGTKSLQICNVAGGISQSLPALPGTVYTLKVYARRSGSATASVGLRFFDKNWTEISAPSVPVTATNYTLHTVTASAPANAAYVESWAWKNAAGCIFADDFCMTSSPAFPACTNNLLASENPGFESNLSKWEWVTNATITTSNVFAGSKSAQVCTSTGGAGNQISATPGATYSLQLNAKINGSPGWAGAGMAFYDANWNKIGSDISRTITATEWSLYLIQGVAPINAKYVDFWFWKEAGGCLFVDDFCATSTGGGNAVCNPNTLFIVGSTTLNAGDTWVRNRLQSLGLTLTIKSATAATTADANGKGLVVISSTVNSTDVGTKFTNVAVPVVTWESYILDDLKMSGTIEGTSYGQHGNYKCLTITDPSHPLSAGLSGTVAVLTSATTMRWGWTTQGGAATAAKIEGEAFRYGIFGFEKGAAMQGGFAAPANRVSLFLDDHTPALLTNKGAQLFDAAIEWALGCKLATFSGNSVEGRSAENEPDETAMLPTTGPVQLYPNPAEDRIFLTFGESYNVAAVVRLFDINGRVIKEWEVITGDVPMELLVSGLRSGQYLLWISEEGKAPVSKRLIIAHSR